MEIKRYGIEGGTEREGSSSRSHGPSKRTAAHVSGQVPMEKGEVVAGGIVPQARKAIENLLAILREAGYGEEHVVRCGVWLDDPRDFAAFNTVFREHFGKEPPARACVVSSMVVDCKVEIDCVAYRKPAP